MSLTSNGVKVFKVSDSMNTADTLVTGIGHKLSVKKTSTRSTRGQVTEDGKTEGRELCARLLLTHYSLR
jgi:hypothetical protein